MIKNNIHIVLRIAIFCVFILVGISACMSGTKEDTNGKNGVDTQVSFEKEETTVEIAVPDSTDSLSYRSVDTETKEDFTVRHYTDSAKIKEDKAASAQIIKLPWWMPTLLTVIATILIGIAALLVYAIFFVKEKKTTVKQTYKNYNSKKTPNQNIKPWSWEDK